MCGLHDVDPSRIGMTGGSGGGTQTFILCAIDPRPAVAFPAVMVSTAMQGGCNCENAPYLRIDTGNVEFAALFAPKPLGMTAADDWTHEMATKGFPELKQHYKLFGAEDNVMLKPLLQFGHNYNYVSRAVIYSWFNKHLKLGLADPIVEEDYRPLSIPELSVWDDQHPAPPGDYAHQQAFLHDLTESTRKQIESLTPKDEDSLKEYRRIVGGAMEVMIGRGLPEAGSLEVADCTSQDLGSCKLTKFLLKYPAKREELPVVRLIPKQWNHRAVIWVDPQGKQSLLAEDGKPRPGVQKLLDAGYDVLAADLFGQGEFTRDGKPLAKAPLVDGHIEFTFGYNPSTFSQRVRDLLTLVAFARGGESVGRSGRHDRPWRRGTLGRRGPGDCRRRDRPRGHRYGRFPLRRRRHVRQSRLPPRRREIQRSARHHRALRTLSALGGRRGRHLADRHLGRLPRRGPS